MATAVVEEGFGEIIARSQATTLEGMGKMFGLTADRQSSAFLRDMFEETMAEATATRQLMYRESPVDPAK